MVTKLTIFYFDLVFCKQKILLKDLLLFFHSFHLSHLKCKIKICFSLTINEHVKCEIYFSCQVPSLGSFSILQFKKIFYNSVVDLTQSHSSEMKVALKTLKILQNISKEKADHQVKYQVKNSFIDHTSVPVSHFGKNWLLYYELLIFYFLKINKKSRLMTANGYLWIKFAFNPTLQLEYGSLIFCQLFVNIILRLISNNLRG